MQSIFIERKGDRLTMKKAEVEERDRKRERERVAMKAGIEEGRRWVASESGS